jgi:hypothetical protein
VIWLLVVNQQAAIPESLLFVAFGCKLLIKKEVSDFLGSYEAKAKSVQSLYLAVLLQKLKQVNGSEILLIHLKFAGKAYKQRG